MELYGDAFLDLKAKAIPSDLRDVIIAELSGPTPEEYKSNYIGFLASALEDEQVQQTFIRTIAGGDWLAAQAIRALGEGSKEFAIGLLTVVGTNGSPELRQASFYALHDHVDGPTYQWAMGRYQQEDQADVRRAIVFLAMRRDNPSVDSFGQIVFPMRKTTLFCAMPSSKHGPQCLPLS